jgi:hypothetical protein
LATTEASEWFEDFLIAIGGILPTWVEAYGINKDPQVEDNTLDYRTVANDLRRVVTQTASRRARLQTGASRISKGSFGPTFAGEEYQYVGSEAAPRGEDAPGKQLNNEVATQGKRGRSIGKLKSKTVSQKRKTTSDSMSRKVCRACEGFHSTQHCY